ncbi:hypothetical protein BLNAU_2735 [Blattamonas nauphoetae]|uniref:Uncharacterized protein n=1 Tax=Blattamonas nauphoetae TaxID=2049346 RepID=A0ABQ9YEG3_9EUKA|nr:hypothetical protein BLNAU_2735 [Blattamonas nauphoetae]
MESPHQDLTEKSVDHVDRTKAGQYGTLPPHDHDQPRKNASPENCTSSFSHTLPSTPPTNPSQHDAPNSTHHPPLTSPTRISSVIFSQEADTSFSAAIQSPYPRNVHSNRIVLSSPTRQQNSSTLPSDDAKQDPWWGSGLAPSSFHPSTTPQLPSSDRPPRPPKYPQPPRQLTLRRSSMEREEEAFDESHNEPTISEATKERKTNKNSERFGLQKMIGSIGNFFSSRAKKKEKSQQQLDNPIAQPRAETSKKDEEATSIQVGREDDQEEGETVEEEGETGNFQSRTEEEENTNQSSIQPNSSVESTHSPPSTLSTGPSNRTASNRTFHTHSTQHPPKLPKKDRNNPQNSQTVAVPQNESENHQFRSINLLSLQSVHYLSYTTQTSQTNSK